MQISFHGAAGDVTGSCHLLEAAGRRILVDCGMFQGSRALDQENAGEFGFDAAAVDLVLLTHAHLDHCGRIPLLCKRGFKGRVLTTAATRELAELVLLDAAGLQAEELRRPDRRNHAAPPAGNAPPHPPLYDANDVHAAMRQFDGVMEYGAARDLFPGLRATFLDAGHILGSASILLELEEGGQRRRVLFSGDLGNHERALLNPPAPAPPADLVVMESTYGDRNHRALADSVAEFEQAVADTLARGGNVVIPTFALERAQDLLFFLSQAMNARRLPAGAPVYLDSPMAISATAIFRRHAELFNPETRALLQAGHDPFQTPGLRFTRSTEDSKAINDVLGGAVIMAGSGMAAGGRVLHHLQHNLSRPECSVIIVGYAAVGTLSRQIVDHAPSVKIYGQTLAVRAREYTIGGFSAHAGHDDLIHWARGAGTAAHVCLVHGEAAGAATLGEGLKQAGLTRVDYPQAGQIIPL